MKKNNNDKSSFISWLNENKVPLIIIMISSIIVNTYINYREEQNNKPQEVSYRQYITDLQSGMDEIDENGIVLSEKEDKIDTVYYNLTTEEWQYTLWTEDSRNAYNEWIKSGKDPFEFSYDYNKEDYRRVEVPNCTSDKLRDHIDKYTGFACRNIVKRNISSGLIRITPNGIMFIFMMIGMVWIYRMMMGRMGGISKDIIVKDTGVRFNDVIGHEEIIEDLKLIVDLMKKTREEELRLKNGTKTGSKDKEEKKSKFNASIPRGMLFSGEAGTGKTMLAKAIAGEAGVPFLYMNASSFVEMYVGLGAKRVRGLFKLARKNSPCIIFIDEIDAVGLDRNSNINSEQKQTINALLQEMDGFDTKAGIFIIAATNNPDSLDKALVRSGRFDRQVVISPPRDYKVRTELFKQYLKEDTYTADIESIARQCVGFTGADINAICNEARLIAIAHGADSITTEILEEAVDRKIFKGNHTMTSKRDEEIDIVAHHEAGHALVSILLGVPVARATIIGTTGGVGGAVFKADESKHLQSKKDILNQVMIAYGGRAAEEIMYGKGGVTTGASNDIQQATALLKGYISEYGFDDALVSLPVLYEQKLYSEYIVTRVRTLSEEIYGQTLKLLQENKPSLLSLADALLKKETMTSDEIYEVIGTDGKCVN